MRDRYAPTLVGARMTGDGHPYLGRAESFRAGSLVRTSVSLVLG